MKSVRFHATLLAALLLGAINGEAGMIDSLVTLNGTTQSDIQVAGQLAILSGPTYLTKAYTDFGVNHVYASSNGTGDSVYANSSWLVNFSLSGGTPGTTVPVTIHFLFEGSLGAAAGDGTDALQFCLGTGSGCDLFNPEQDRTTGTSNFLGDQCTAFTDPSVNNANQNINNGHGGCAGNFYYDRLLTTNAFQIGNQSSLNGMISSQAGLGYVDAFNTGRILSITVPDGVSWTYQDGVTGNPLNFETQSTANAPEPGTAVMIGLGFLALGVGWLRRRV